jgi:hypothetical protein
LVAVGASGDPQVGTLSITAGQDPVSVDVPSLTVVDSLEILGNVRLNGEDDTLTLDNLAIVRGQSDDLSGLVLSDVPYTAIEVDGLQLGDAQDTATVYIVIAPNLDRIRLDLVPGSRIDRLVLSDLPALTTVEVLGVDAIRSLSVARCPELDPCDLRPLEAMAEFIASDSQRSTACAE